MDGVGLLQRYMILTMALAARKNHLPCRAEYLGLNVELYQEESMSQQSAAQHPNLNYKTPGEITFPWCADFRVAFACSRAAFASKLAFSLFFLKLSHQNLMQFLSR